ncbi:MAG: hypothetical protein RhofKO_19480 [Rhodothermales bacterium]
MSKRILALSTVIAIVSVYFSFFRQAPDDSSPSAEIRVRVFEREKPEALTLHAVSSLDLLDERGYLVGTHTHDPFTPITVVRHRGSLRVDTGERTLTTSGVVAHSTSASALAVETKRAGIKRAYHGKVVVHADPAARSGLYVVNHVNIDDYVASVVVWEYGAHHLEGMKAMSVVARTYATRKLDPTKPYDVVDHQRDQVYKGIERVTAEAKQAAYATSGQVLTHNGQLINAVHFASSGGHTANNEDVWRGAPTPYLRGKRDPYDQGASYITWDSSIKRARLLDILSKHHNTRVTGVAIGDVSSERRVKTMKLTLANGRTLDMRGTEFRSVVTRAEGIAALRSTLFVMQRSGNQYMFQGRGFGHGVGLSQIGARAMAEQGMSYDDILSFYYTDVRLENRAPSRVTQASTSLPADIAGDPFLQMEREGRVGASTAGTPSTSTLPPDIANDPFLRMEMEGRIGNPDGISSAPSGNLPPEIANDPFLRMEMEGRIGNTDQRNIYSPADVHAQRYASAQPTPPTTQPASSSRRSGW